MSAPPISGHQSIDLSPSSAEVRLAPRCELLGIAIDDSGFDQAIATLRATLISRQPRTLFFVNAHTLELGCRDRAYRALFAGADFVFGDGTGVRWGARMKGRHLRANLNGTDLIPAMMSAANDAGHRYYLLGSTPEELARTIAAMSQRFDGWMLCGAHHGYLDANLTETVVADIAIARPDLLLVAMGNPIQEQWIAAHRSRLAATLVAGVGGLFLYLNGDYWRAPIVFRRWGIEWLGILFTQRWKWRRYLIDAPIFLARVAFECVREGRR